MLEESCHLIQDACMRYIRFTVIISLQKSSSTIFAKENANAKMLTSLCSVCMSAWVLFGLLRITSVCVSCPNTTLSRISGFRE